MNNQKIVFRKNPKKKGLDPYFIVLVFLRFVKVFEVHILLSYYKNLYFNGGMNGNKDRKNRSNRERVNHVSILKSEIVDSKRSI